jgi:hypothetical protein
VDFSSHQKWTGTIPKAGSDLLASAVDAGSSYQGEMSRFQQYCSLIQSLEGDRWLTPACRSVWLGRAPTSWPTERSPPARVFRHGHFCKQMDQSRKFENGKSGSERTMLFYE